MPAVRHVDVVNAMADTAVAVIVGAWDAEGLLIWEPAAPATASADG